MKKPLIPHKIDIEKFKVGEIQPFPNGGTHDICKIAGKINEIISFLTPQEEEKKRCCQWGYFGDGHRCAKSAPNPKEEEKEDCYCHYPELHTNISGEKIYHTKTVCGIYPPSKANEIVSTPKEESWEKTFDDQAPTVYERTSLHYKNKEFFRGLLSKAVEAERAKFREIVKKDSDIRITNFSDDYERGFDYGYDTKKSEILTEIK